MSRTTLPRALLECCDGEGELDYERVIQFHKKKRDEGKRLFEEMRTCVDVCNELLVGSCNTMMT